MQIKLEYILLEIQSNIYNFSFFHSINNKYILDNNQKLYDEIKF